MSLFHIFLVIVILALLIAFHEFGHFICAKVLGVPVKIFSIGFPLGPKPLWSYQWGETDIQLNPLPLGGFCAFMDDENQEDAVQDENTPNIDDKNFLKNRAIWERTIIISGGVIANIIVAYLIFLGLAFSFGIPDHEPLGVVIENVKQGSPAEQAGLQKYDQILQVAQTPVKTSEDMIGLIADNKGRAIQIKVQRGETVKSLQTTPSSDTGTIGVEISGLVKVNIFVKEVLPNKPAETAGFKAGDKLLAINGKPISTPQELGAMAQANKGQPLNIKVLRNKETLLLTPTVNAEGMIGIKQKFVESYRPLASVGEAFTFSYQQLINTSYMLLNALWRLVSGQLPLDQIGGLVEVVHIGTQISQDSFVMLTRFAALISIELAILNILPIPALDGGHLFLLFIEALRGKPLPRHIEEKMHYAGFMILLGLGVLLIFKDIWGLTLGGN